MDEAQFFPDLRDFSLQAADLEAKHVVLAGLDGDFQRQRFGQVSGRGRASRALPLAVPLQWQRLHLSGS